MIRATDRPASFRKWLTIVGILLMMCLFLPVRVLELADKQSGNVLYRWIVSTGDTLAYRYIHSVEKTPVEAWFSVEPDNRLQLTETRFPSYGAGLPNAVGETRSVSGWIALNSTYEMEAFTTYFSSINKPIIRLKKSKWHIAHLFQDGDILKLSVSSRLLGKVFPSLLFTRIRATALPDAE